MRMLKQVMSSATAMLLAFAVPAMASPLAFMQDPPPVKVDITTTESTTTWYTDPLWITIGALAFLLFIVLIVMASRGREGGTTTVVR